MKVPQVKTDGLVKSLQGRHSREACPRPDRGEGVHKHLIFLDSRFHGNDNNRCFLTFYEFIKTEFVVGDVLRLPFRRHASVASLNLVDKIPFLLAHLREMNRVAGENNSQFLFSDPFSWSSDVAKEGGWLGETTKGVYAGKGVDNIRSLLTTGSEVFLPEWKIEKQVHIWGKIRNHKNHFELILSCFIQAIR